MLASLKARAKRLQTETYALYLAYKDPAVPWYARAFAAFVVAHTVSPIDLIPDFIPVLGYLDDLIITPVGIALALRMIPPEVMTRARQAAAEASADGRINTRAGIAIVAATWAVTLIIVGVVVARALRK
jgi:uncharacterized membrane protein YkvA (DUF1232 family)